MSPVAGREAELRRLRRTLMSSSTLREGSASVVEAMLLAVDGRDDAELVFSFDGIELDGPLAAGELRSRLRATLAELAASDLRSQPR